MAAKTRHGRTPDPGLVFECMQAAWWQLRRLMDLEWQARWYDALSATGAERERLIIKLLRSGLRSPAAALFQAIRFQARSPERMAAFHLEQARQRLCITSDRVSQRLG